jgi:glutathione synthase/RimK-type ligase-like ATP-grasp enzyme
MILTYSGRSAPTARVLSTTGDDLGIEVSINRGNEGDINWGRAQANTRLNPDTSKTTNKRVMRELFAANNVPMPELVPVQTAVEQAERGFIVGRPDTHTQGRGFWLCSSALHVRRALQGTSKKKAATHFMKYVSAPREYRVHVFMGKSIRISEKIFGTTGETAHGLYTTGKPTHNVKHVRAAAKKAVEAVGLDFGAVDVLADDNDCWVLEVNSAPGLGGSMPKLYLETFKKWEDGLW